MTNAHKVNAERFLWDILEYLLTIGDDDPALIIGGILDTNFRPYQADPFKAKR